LGGLPWSKIEVVYLGTDFESASLVTACVGVLQYHATGVLAECYASSAANALRALALLLASSGG
jgi:hypothetical protein